MQAYHRQSLSARTASPGRSPCKADSGRGRLVPSFDGLRHGIVKLIVHTRTDSSYDHHPYDQGSGLHCCKLRNSCSWSHVCAAPWPVSQTSIILVGSTTTTRRGAGFATCQLHGLPRFQVNELQITDVRTSMILPAALQTTAYLSTLPPVRP